jgi:hypothetical protein
MQSGKEAKPLEWMTMRQLIMILAKLRVQEINGHRILFPLTKEQKAIFKAFNVVEPV